MIFKYNLGVPISAENICQKASTSTQAPQPHLVLLDIQLGCFIGRLPFLKRHWNFRMVGGKGTEKSQKKLPTHKSSEKVMIDIELQLSSSFLKKNTHIKNLPTAFLEVLTHGKNPPLDIPQGCHDQFIIQKEVSKMCHLCFPGLLMFLCCMQVLTAFRIHLSFYPWAIHQFFLRSKLLPPAAETVVANPPAAPLASSPPSPCRPGRNMAQLFPSKKCSSNLQAMVPAKYNFKLMRDFSSKKSSSLFFCTRGGVRVTILNSKLARRKHKFSAQPTSR